MYTYTCISVEVRVEKSDGSVRVDADERRKERGQRAGQLAKKQRTPRKSTHQRETSSDGGEERLRCSCCLVTKRFFVNLSKHLWEKKGKNKSSLREASWKVDSDVKRHDILHFPYTRQSRKGTCRPAPPTHACTARV